MAPIPRIYFIRHAETAANSGGGRTERIRGCKDYPPSPEGLAKVARTANYLSEKGIKINHIYTSPLTRAVATAKIISSDLGKVPWTPVDALKSWCSGVLQGLPLNKANKATEAWFLRNSDQKIPEGESYDDFIKRWGGAIEKLVKYAREHPSETLLVITHSKNFHSLRHVLTKGRKPVDDLSPRPGGVFELTLLSNGKFWLGTL